MWAWVKTLKYQDSRHALPGTWQLCYAPLKTNPGGFAEWCASEENLVFRVSKVLDINMGPLKSSCSTCLLGSSTPVSPSSFERHAFFTFFRLAEDVWVGLLDTPPATQTSLPPTNVLSHLPPAGGIVGR